MLPSLPFRLNYPKNGWFLKIRTKFHFQESTRSSSFALVTTFSSVVFSEPSHWPHEHQNTLPHCQAYAPSYDRENRSTSFLKLSDSRYIYLTIAVAGTAQIQIGGKFHGEDFHQKSRNQHLGNFQENSPPKHFGKVPNLGGILTYVCPLYGYGLWIQEKTHPK